MLIAVYGERATRRLQDAMRQKSNATTATSPNFCKSSAVAGLGIQVLFGFLLSLPFTMRFSRLDSTQRDLYVCSLVVSALSIALLSAPVAHHRVLFRRHLKEQILRFANILAVLGLCAVGFAVSTAVLLVTSFVAHGVVVPKITGSTFLTFYGLWFGVPNTIRIRANSEATPSRTVDVGNKDDARKTHRAP